MNVSRPRTQSSAIPAERTVTLLGATGSIGSSTIDLLKRERKQYRVEAVTAHRNASALAGIARQPEQAGAIRGTMILMAALVEGVALIAVVFCLVLSFVA